MEKIKAQNRIRQANYKAKQKLLASNVTSNVTDNVTVTLGNATEEDIEEEKEIEVEREKIDYQLIADLYNDTCVSFPAVKALSDARKKAIKARLKTYSIEDFKLLFEKAEASDFLKGGNDRNWSANFDWLIKDSNMAKVLDGNYDNKVSRRPSAESRLDVVDAW